MYVKHTYIHIWVPYSLFTPMIHSASCFTSLWISLVCWSCIVYSFHQPNISYPTYVLFPLFTLLHHPVPTNMLCVAQSVYLLTMNMIFNIFLKVCISVTLILFGLHNVRSSCICQYWLQDCFVSMKNINLIKCIHF